MSSEFTEYPLENEQVEVYASTNKYMCFAIERLDATYVPISDWDGIARPILQDGITQWYDTLLPIELKHIDFRPAEKLMKHWLELFFFHRSRRWLISTEADYSDRKLYRHPADLSDEERQIYPQGKWARTAGDVGPDTVTGSFFGIVESRDASTIKMLNLMHEFLTWFPGDHQLALDNRSLLEHCVKWALAFNQYNRGKNIYGHHAGGWGLYNFVHTGPLAGTSLNPAEWADQDLRARFEAWLDERKWPAGEPPPKEFYDWLRDTFETYFRFALEGIPDSWWVIVGDYGGVAQAFVHLSKVLEDARYDELVTEISDSEEIRSQFPNVEIRQFAKQFAALINNGLWNARLNQNTCLMPSIVTPIGPLPGDPGPAPLPGEPVPELKYQSDTDCLYWVHPLLGAYQLVGEVRPDLRPSGLENLICSALGWIFGRRAALRCEIRRRKQRLVDLLDGDFPDKYLGMALGLTLDWIRYGWVPEWRQFVSKIYHDGTRSTNIIYDDGKYNTLRMLSGAYKVTHDDFYLRIFDDAWGKYEELAQHPSLGGFFPKAITAGELHLEDNCVGLDEERLEGDTRPACYDPGQEGFLGFIVDAYLATVEAGEPQARYLTTAEAFAERILEAHRAGRISCSGHAFLRFALARGTLRRIQFTIWEDAVALEIQHDGETFQVARSNSSTFSQAVVYMDLGDYSIHYRRADLTESVFREFTIGASTVSIHILEDRLLVSEEGIA